MQIIRINIWKDGNIFHKKNKRMQFFIDFWKIDTFQDERNEYSHLATFSINCCETSMEKITSINIIIIIITFDINFLLLK